MPQLLTKKKKRWVGKRKPEVLRGTPLNPNISDAMRYKKRLDKLIKAMVDDTQKQLKALFKTESAQEYFAEDASISSQARIITNALIKKYEEIFGDASKILAEQTVEEANKSSTTALHASLKQLSGGLLLKTSAISQQTKEVLNASITENVALIKSIPQKYLNGVQQAVMRSITNGRGLYDLVPYLQKEAGATYKRANLIALDQTRKAFNAIDKAKMQDLGIEEFEWLHSGGSSHPRKMHIALSGQIFRMDDPPIIDEKGTRGYPGDAPNCRCRYIPVIKFD